MSDIHILGPGSLGRLWAAKLHPSTRVTLIKRPQAGASSSTLEFDLETSPAVLGDPDAKPLKESLTIPVLEPSALAPASIHTLLVFTKSYQTLDALKSLKHALTNQTHIVLFQNGMGSQVAVKEAFPDNPLSAAVTTEGANRRGNKVIHAGRGQTQIGGLNTRGKKLENELSDCLAKSTLEIAISLDIWEKLWLKLAINCGINPFTAICDCPNGRVPQQELFQSLWPALLAELRNMLETAGYPNTEQELSTLIKGVMQSTSENISSMLQDLRNHRRTEIDDINGFAANYLKQNELGYSANQQLWEQVNALRN